MTPAVKPVLRYLRRAVVLWVGTIFFVAGSAAAVSALREWSDARRFAREAVTAAATVVAKSLAPASRDGNPRTRYLVTYRFAANGDAVEQTEELPVEDWEALEEGSPLAVRYRPADLGTARSRDASPAWVPPFVAAVTSLFALLGIAIALPSWRRALALWRLHGRGVAAEGTVTEVGLANVTINRVPQWRLRYEFRDMLGRTHTAESDLLAPHEAAEWQAGARGWVRYERERPAISVWIGTS